MRDLYNNSNDFLSAPKDVPDSILSRFMSFWHLIISWSICAIQLNFSSNGMPNSFASFKYSSSLLLYLSLGNNVLSILLLLLIIRTCVLVGLTVNPHSLLHFAIVSSDACALLIKGFNCHDVSHKCQRHSMSFITSNILGAACDTWRCNTLFIESGLRSYLRTGKLFKLHWRMSIVVSQSNTLLQLYN